MTIALHQLSQADLRDLASALKTRRISAPYSELQVQRVLAPNLVGSVTSALQELASTGFQEPQIAILLDTLYVDRSNGRNSELPIDLVTSGPEAPEIANRDTGVVVRELFSHAKESVLVVGYAVYQGATVFEALAERMETLPDLEVKLFLNIARPDNDSSPAEIIVSKYTQRFRDSQWPQEYRLPQVYYDPRSVAENKRSSLHAKCIVVDEKQVFVSSANFTKAAQERNIEVGLKIDSPWLAGRLRRHFQLLQEHGLALQAL